MYRLKEYSVYDNLNRGNNYRGIVMIIYYMEDYTNYGNDYRGNIIMVIRYRK